MKTIILNWENAEENADVYDFLQNIIETDDILTLFEGDPDMLMIDGERVLFVDFTHNDTQYVIYCDGSYTASEEMIIKMLEAFYSTTVNVFESVETEGIGWTAFQNNMIAYRGGRGYSYNIWKYISA